MAETKKTTTAKTTTKKPVVKIVDGNGKAIAPDFTLDVKVEENKEPEFVFRKITREEKMKYLTGNWD